MKSTEKIERAIQDDPQRLSEYIDEISRQLSSDDVHERADAGRAVRAAAAEDASLVEPYRDLVTELLDDANGSLQLSGLVSLAELAARTPEAVTGEVPRLVRMLKATDAPAIEMEVIKTLTRIGSWSPAQIKDADAVVADRLRTATTPIKSIIVTVFVEAVLEEPSRFPETVQATEAALDDDSARVRRYAASAISLIAAADATVLSSLDAVHDRVAEMEGRVNSGYLQPDQNLVDALDRLEPLVDDADADVDDTAEQ